LHSQNLCVGIFANFAETRVKAADPSDKMTVHPKFTESKPVSLKKYPVVLRFKGLWPRDLRRFIFHDLRRGGDLAHVDLGLTDSNRVLCGEDDWDQVIRDEVAQMKQHNFEEHIAALEAKSRKSEAEKVEEAGPADPWRVSKEGPLREGILTVNKDWFGGSGQAKWDPERVKEFRRVAMKFLRRSFPNGQLRFASIHMDEEALHIHFVVAVWTEKPSANRGRQILLQPSQNPLLRNYELAQDMAGAAFAKIGITRGERRAEARRGGGGEDKPLERKRRHVPQSEWRAEERRKAQEEKKRLHADSAKTAKATVEDGRDLAKAAVKKSRKRAIKEAQARKKRAAQETAEAIRLRDTVEQEALQFEKAAAAASSRKMGIEAEVGALEPLVKGYEERAEKALEKFRQSVTARKAEEKKLEQASKQAQTEDARVAAAKKHYESLQLGLQLFETQQIRWEPLRPGQPRQLVWGAPGSKPAPLPMTIEQRLAPAKSLFEMIIELICQILEALFAPRELAVVQDIKVVQKARVELGLEPEMTIADVLARRTGEVGPAL